MDRASRIFGTRLRHVPLIDEGHEDKEEVYEGDKDKEEDDHSQVDLPIVSARMDVEQGRDPTPKFNINAYCIIIIDTRLRYIYTRKI